MSKGCGKLRCPNCGFEMPARAPSILKGIRNLIDRATVRRGHAQEGGCARSTLADLSAGEDAVVTGIDRSDAKRMKRLLALGVLPGEKIRVLEKYPTYVFSVGSTRMAVDEKTAGAIAVAPAAS
jgi:Fe2+ transport system protein FeoA